MKLAENISLSQLTTMRLGGTARYVIEVNSQSELMEAVNFARSKKIPWFVLGAGSNVIAGEDYNGVIILNRVHGFKKITEDSESTTYKIGAGEVWDNTVEKLCSLNLSGVEAMSAIPGYSGATPIQNVGAYGQEIADTLVEVEAYDTDTDQFVNISKEDCGFSYRNSRFKKPESRHHIITSITLKLRKKHLSPPFYPALEKYLKDNNIHDYSPQNIRNAVIEIRSNKLPPVDKIASAGSFFKNPIVTLEEAGRLLSTYPDMPNWPMPNKKVKLAAGWLIEKAGLKGFSKCGMEVYRKNALVMVNSSANSIADLKSFTNEVIDNVQNKFSIVLEQEPENLPESKLSN